LTFERVDETKPMDELTHLLLTAGDGDREALTELVQRTQPDVWRFCAAIVGAAAADDATQDTFIRAWKGVHNFEGKSSAKTWLFAIAKRVCFDADRRSQRAPRATARIPDAGGGDHEERVALEDLMARLAPDRRAAFVLTQLLGLSYEDAARVCGCPVGTIRSRIARARAELLAGTLGAASDRGRTNGHSV
jgi:RNA polymerase sigma-70 factor (ECF subfamily)